MATRTKAQPNGTPTWLALHAPDTDAAKTFYQGLFGWEIANASPSNGGHMVAMKDGRAVAGIVPAADPAAGPPCWVTYLATDDIDGALAKVDANGGTALGPVREEGAQARTALACDPGGAVFGLWQAKDLPGMGAWEEYGTLTWSDNFTPDVEQAKGFYGAVFGMRYLDPISWHFGDPSTSLQGYSMFSADGNPVEMASNARGSLGQLDPHDPIDTPHWTTYIATPDTHEAARTAAQLGGTVMLAPYDTAFGPVSAITDNQGAHLTLAPRPPQG